MRIFLALFALTLLTSAATAAATQWQEVAPETRMRLVSSDRLEDGKVLVGVEVDMPADYKTYWRIPGETGVPTSIEGLGSVGFAEPTIFWPHPLVHQTEGYLDFVYLGPTVLPMQVEGTGGELALRVTMGICSDICVPVQASFRLPIDPARPDAGQALRLRQAMASVPISPPDDSMIGPVELTGDQLQVPLLAAGIDPQTVIAAGSGADLLFGAPQKSPDNNLVILPLLGGDGQSLVGQTIQISFMTPAGPFVVERVIAAGGST